MRPSMERGNDLGSGPLLIQLSDAGHYRRLEFGVLRSNPSGSIRIWHNEAPG
jgi:hypothetical protein